MTLPGPENGHLRMPNPIVDRLALLRLNGTQWQILWAVWRRTLCWQKSGNWGNRPYPIGISDLVEATRVNQHQVKRETHKLVKMNIILRDETPGGRGHKPMTSFNLDISTWKVPKGSEEATVSETVAEETPIEVGKGSELVTPIMEEVPVKGSGFEPPPVPEKLPFPDKSATLSLSNSKLGKKHLKKPKETPSTKVEGTKPPDLLAPQTPASKYFFEKTGRKRWKNLVQKEEFEKTEADVGEDRMIEAINWALLSNISNIKSILTAARKGGKHDTGTKPAPDSTKPGYPDRRFSGFHAIESGPGDRDKD